MIIGKINDGIVLDHIKAGKGMEIYNLLQLGKLDCQVAIIKNAESTKMGKKDIIKIDKMIDVNLDAIGYIDPGITVNFIEGGKLAKRKHLELPEKVTDVIKCKNPRCITTIEQELPHVFQLVDREKKIYRCIYCEAQA
ncbi:MAG: aspartate carbamoyltransferase regulatory subunit [Firmicutes bacterium]|nr:aspartate carbamoyltransferase regulatory subunit [Bacillota bacterium]